MAHTFNFRTKHSYDTTQTGITIPVELSDGLKVVQITPKLDTGASFCIFERTYGVGSSRVDLQACKLEYSIVSPK